MESKLINCPKCGKRYKVFLEAHNYFQCYDCDGIIEYNSTPLQRRSFIPRPPVPATRPQINLNHPRVVSYRTNVVEPAQPIKRTAPTTQRQFTKTHENKGRLGLWVILSVLLYLLCAFTQFNMDISEWSSICRAIFAIGVIGFGVLAASVNFD
jgi:hypothetical protein